MPEPSDTDTRPDLHEQVVAKLAGVVDEGESLDVAERAHVDSCLQCQAELVRYRKLLRALHDLRTNVIQPRPGMLADILDGLAERGERRAMRSMVTGRRAAYTGGIAVATIAGVTGVILLAGRSKKTPKKAA